MTKDYFIAVRVNMTVKELVETLAKKLGVSKAEVMRRGVLLLAEQQETNK